jgi:membrane protease YdiL (CAAX protease family)
MILYSSDIQTDIPFPIQIIENPLKIYLIIGIIGSLFANKGPAISAFIFAYITQGKEGCKYWIKRIFYWRIGVIWYILLFIMVFAIKYSIPITVSLFGIGEVTAFEALSFSALVFLFIENLIPSGGQEEIGWRYVQLKLQEHYSLPITALINGFMNWLWHIPLYLFFFSWSGMALENIWFFLLYEIPLQFIFCFLTNETESVLPAILMHALFNTLGTFYFTLKPGIDPNLLYLPFLGVCYLFVFLIFLKNGRTFSSKPKMVFNLKQFENPA